MLHEHLPFFRFLYDINSYVLKMCIITYRLLRHVKLQRSTILYGLNNSFLHAIKVCDISDRLLADLFAFATRMFNNVTRHVFEVKYRRVRTRDFGGNGIF